MTKRVMGVPIPPPGHPGGISVPDSENAEVIADSLETQFQPVTVPSVPAAIEMVDVALRSQFMTPASEPKLTNPEEVQEAINGLKFSKASGPNGIPNRALKHLLQRAISLVQIFNAVLTHLPTVWKHARLICVFKPGKEQHCLILSAH
jgi:hypothetical protein